MRVSHCAVSSWCPSSCTVRSISKVFRPLEREEQVQVQSAECRAQNAARELLSEAGCKHEASTLIHTEMESNSNNVVLFSLLLVGDGGVLSLR